MQAPPCDLLICVGEASGDAYGAAVVRELRRRRPELVIAAMGGPQLAEAGAEIEHHIEGLAVMGLWPVLARLPSFIRLMRRVEATVRLRRPRAVLTIDYPGFNLRLLRRLAPLRREGLRLVHLVAPQVWAWKPRRAKPVAQTVDRLLCFFPFEPPLFTRFGCHADFVGHPLLDLIPERPDTGAVDRELGLAPGQPLLLVAPGSRQREVAGLLPVFHRAAEAFLRRHPGAVAAVARCGELPVAAYREHTDLPLVEGRYRELCARARAGLIASGTATLEAAILGLPHIISYRVDPITAAIGRQVLVTPHIGLPNILHGERVCPEVVQDEFTAPRLVAHLERLWDGPQRDACFDRLAATRDRLGAGGALGRVADAVIQELVRGRRKVTRIERPTDAGSGGYSVVR